MGATPSAAVLKFVTCLSNDSWQDPVASRGLVPGWALELLHASPTLSDLFSTVSKHLITVSNNPCCRTSILSSLASYSSPCNRIVFKLFLKMAWSSRIPKVMSSNLSILWIRASLPSRG